MKKLVCLAGVLSAMTPAIASVSDTMSMQAKLDEKGKVIFPLQRPTEAKRYIVQFKPDANASARASNDALFKQGKFSADNAARMVEGLGGNIKRKLPSVSGLAAELTPAQAMQLKKDSRVAFIEEDPIRSVQANGTSYGINMIQANQVSDAPIGNQKVCIIDTGYDINHEDLMSGANVTGEVSNTLTRDIDLGVWSDDSYGHGTHVAGTISALNNSVGVDGVSPNGLLNLHIVKVIHKSTWWRWYGSDVIDAVSKCQTAGANVINMSLAGTKNSVAEQQALDTAYNNGVLLVGASGNAGSSSYFYPASYDSVISVGAVDQSSSAWMYTQQNDQIELAAPGVGINSTLPGNQYGQWDGTSMATPFVSGAAALVWSHYPQCTNAQVRNALQQSAQDLGSAGRDDTYGHGLIQAKAALDYLAANACDGGGSQNPPPVSEGTNPVEPSVLTASTEYSAPYKASNAIDGILGNNDDHVWFAQYDDIYPWLQFDFEQSPKVIKSYQLARGYCINNSYVPSIWKVYASNDASNWTLLQDINTDQVDASSCTQMSDKYTFANATAYRYYKLEFDTTNYNASVAIAEIQLFD